MPGNDVEFQGDHGLDCAVYNASLVIFLEFFSWGLLTMPLINVLKDTFPDNAFLMNGVVMGIKGILSFLSAPIVGGLSDRWGRKLFLFITVLFTCSPIPMLTLHAGCFFIMVALSGLFAVTFSVVFAYVSDVTTVNNRSRGYGLVSAMFALSLVLSPGVGAFIMETFGNRVVSVVSTTVAALDVLFIACVVRETLTEKLRPSWSVLMHNAHVNPIGSLWKVGKDRTILKICAVVFLSFLPEAAQYSCVFVYLKLRMGFEAMEVAIFIAVTGTISFSIQVMLGVFMRLFGAKRTILFGLILEVMQLLTFGFGRTKWAMWVAGFLAGLSTITYPAVSAFVSFHTDEESQGIVQGIITGIRGLCNGIGPAVFGVIFYLCEIDLHSEQIVILKSADTTMDEEIIVPGPPYIFGAILVILAIIVTLFIPGKMEEIREREDAHERSQHPMLYPTPIPTTSGAPKIAIPPANVNKTRDGRKP